jgi:hypothetical protein
MTKEDLIKARRFMEHVGHADFCSMLKTTKDVCECGYKEALKAILEPLHQKMGEQLCGT